MSDHGDDSIPEADRIEQETDVLAEEEDQPQALPDADMSADEADLWEQSQPAGGDDDDYDPR